MRVRVRYLTVVVLLAALLITSARVAAQSPTSTQAQIERAFVAIHVAEADGGNVTSLVSTLNQAINLTETADLLNSTHPQAAATLYSQAYSLASDVLQNAPVVAAQGRANLSASTVKLYEETAVLGGLAVAVYFFTPRVFWRIWLEIHRGLRVKRA